MIVNAQTDTPFDVIVLAPGLRMTRCPKPEGELTGIKWQGAQRSGHDAFIDHDGESYVRVYHAGCTHVDWWHLTREVQHHHRSNSHVRVTNERSSGHTPVAIGSKTLPPDEAGVQATIA